jgi:hypothetical protein
MSVDFEDTRQLRTRGAPEGAKRARFKSMSLARAPQDRLRIASVVEQPQRIVRFVRRTAHDG